MPRIIDPKVDRVVGPLRMKVHTTATSVGSTDPSPMNHNHNYNQNVLPAFSSNRPTRRGRYSRKSKSSASPSQASLLFGKPIEENEGVDKNVSVNTNTKAFKSVELRNSTSTTSDKTDLTTSNHTSALSIELSDPKNVGFHNSDSTPIGVGQRHALALDTRNLLSNNNSDIGASNYAALMVCNFKKFVTSLCERGVIPSVLSAVTTATTANISSSNAKHNNKQIAAAIADLGLGIESYKFDGDKTPTVRKMSEQCDSFLSAVDIESISSGSIHGAVSIPLPLHATYSWLIFAALVDSILAEDAKIAGFVSSKNLQKSKVPISVTIVCSDVSLFCDTNISSHQNALKGFLDHINPYFDQDLLSSIRFIVASTSGIIGLKDKEKINTKSSDTSGVDDQANFTRAMHDCVLNIESTIDEFVQRNSMQNSESKNASLNVSLSIMQNTSVDFASLSHSLVRESLNYQDIRLTCRLRNIQLPISADGTNCSISLEASYQTFPFSVNTLQAKMLSNDLKKLSTMNLNVVQLIPLASVDVCLLLGIPIVVRAGMNEDYDQYREMTFIVGSLLRILQKQEQALLLQGLTDTNDESSVDGVGLFHDQQVVHYFILMAKEIPTNMLNNENYYSTPNSGLLFQLANCDQLLHDSTLNLVQEQHSATEEEMMYTEHVENALSTLHVSTYNPYLNLSGDTCRAQPEANKLTNEVLKEDIDNMTMDVTNESSDAIEPETTHPITPLADAPSPSHSNRNVSNEVTMFSIYDLSNETIADYMDMDDVSCHDTSNGE